MPSLSFLRHIGALTLLLLVSALAAPGAVWTVATDGLDTNPGTPAQPLLTVQRAVDLASAGDTIEIRGGYYYSPSRIRIGKDHLTLRSAAGEWAVLETGIEDPSAQFSTIFYNQTVRGARLERLEIIGGYYYGVMLGSNWAWGVGTAVQDVVIADCVIHDTGRDAIKVSANVRNVVIERCRIYNTGIGPHNAGSPNAEGVDIVNGHNIVIRGCYVHDTSTSGMYAKGGSSDIVFENNLIVNAGTNGIVSGYTTDADFRAPDSNFVETFNHIIRNNVIINTGLNQNSVAIGKGHNGIMVRSTHGCRVLNNTVINAGHGRDASFAYPLAIGNETPSVNNRDLVIMNNLFYQQAGHGSTVNRGARQMVQIGVTVEGEFIIDHNFYFHEEGPAVFNSYVAELGGAGHYHDYWKLLGRDLNAVVDVAPQFAQLDPASGQLDAHLTATSPARGAGGPTAGLVPLDYDGDVRPASGADIGADQYNVSAALPMPPPDGSAGTGWDAAPPPAPVFSALAITPTDAIVYEGQSLSLTAAAFDQYGASVPLPDDVEWSAETSGNGSIDANGLFASAQPGGPYTITAAVHGVSATTTISVLATAYPASFTLTPPLATIYPNQTQQFTAQVFDQHGHPWPATITWSADTGGNGNIDASGLFTPGDIGGPFTITASADGLGFSATAEINVVSIPMPAGIVSVSPARFSIDAPLDGQLRVNFGGTTTFQYTEGSRIRLYKAGQATPVWELDPDMSHPNQGQSAHVYDTLPLEPNTTYYVLTEHNWARLNFAPWSPGRFLTPDDWTFTTRTRHAEWRHQRFGEHAHDPAIAGNLADPDGDGVVNLLEYATDADPLAADGNRTQLLTLDGQDGACLALAFPMRPADTSLTYTVQWSTDLQTWHDGSTYSGDTSTPDTTHTLEHARADDDDLRWITVRATQPVSAGTGFLRLRVMHTP